MTKSEYAHRFPKNAAVLVTMQGGPQGTVVQSWPFLYKDEWCVNAAGFGNRPVFMKRLREIM